jgi:hypothetical protein
MIAFIPVMRDGMINTIMDKQIAKAEKYDEMLRSNWCGKGS